MLNCALAMWAVGAALTPLQTPADIPTVERQGGLLTLSFPAPEGTIRVYLPDDLSAGDTISGTVIAEPKGATDPEREKNAAALAKYSITTPQTSSTDAGGYRKWQLPKFTQVTGLRFQMTSPEGKGVGELVARVQPERVASPSNMVPPDLGVIGRPFPVPGPFDGDLGNTKTTFGGLPVQPLAESPGQMICAPPTLLGKTRFECSDGTHSTAGDVRLVTFNIQVTDPVIRVGQSTNAQIRIGGLDEMGSGPVKCVVINHNPSIVELEGGDLVPIQIELSQVGSDGSFRKRLRITARSVGLYSLTLRGETRSQVPMGSSPPVPTVVEPDSDPPPIPFEVRLSGLPNPIRGNRPLRIVAESVRPDVPIEAALFSVRLEPNGSWETLGTDSNPEGGFSVEWDRSDFAGGTYSIRVDASGGDGQQASDQRVVTMEDPNGLPSGSMQFENRNFQRDFTQISASIVTVSDSTIRSKRNRATNLRNAAEERRRRARELEDAARAAWERAARKRSQAAALERLDRNIENVLRNAAAQIDVLVKRIEELKGALAGQGDPAAIDKAVADLQQAVDDCEKECAKRRQAVVDAEKRIADLEQELENLANEVNDLFHGDGWTGSARFDRGAGIVRWGFVRDGSSGSEIANWGPKSQRVSDLRRKKNQLAKDLKKAKQDLEDAKDALADCEKECEAKKKALEDAKKAQEQKDEAAANEAKIDESVAELDKALAELESYLDRNPDLPADLKDKLDRLRGKFPIDSDEWEALKKEIDDFLKRKLQVEEALRKEAEAEDAKGNGDWGKANDLRGEADGLDDEARREDNAASDLEAEKRRQEARAAEEAKKRDEERARAEAEQHRKCIEEFKKWIQDNIDRGILPEDALEKFENWLNEHAGKIPDLVGVIGKVLEGVSTGATGTGLANGLTALGATIFYWWAEAELKAACARLSKKIDERTKQLIALELLEQRPPKPCGVIQPKQNTSETWFYFRKGNKVLLFKITRSGGLECMGEISLR